MNNIPKWQSELIVKILRDRYMDHILEEATKEIKTWSASALKDILSKMEFIEAMKLKKEAMLNFLIDIVSVHWNLIIETE